MGIPELLHPEVPGGFPYSKPYSAAGFSVWALIEKAADLQSWSTVNDHHAEEGGKLPTFLGFFDSLGENWAYEHKGIVINISLYS